VVSWPCKIPKLEVPKNYKNFKYFAYFSCTAKYEAEAKNRVDKSTSKFQN